MNLENQSYLYPVIYSKTENRTEKESVLTNWEEEDTVTYLIFHVKYKPGPWAELHSCACKHTDVTLSFSHACRRGRVQLWAYVSQRQLRGATCISQKAMSTQSETSTMTDFPHVIERKQPLPEVDQCAATQQRQPDGSVWWSVSREEQVGEDRRGRSITGVARVQVRLIHTFSTVLRNVHRILFWPNKDP